MEYRVACILYVCVLFPLAVSEPLQLLRKAYGWRCLYPLPFFPMMRFFLSYCIKIRLRFRSNLFIGRSLRRMHQNCIKALWLLVFTLFGRNSYQKKICSQLQLRLNSSTGNVLSPFLCSVRSTSQLINAVAC